MLFAERNLQSSRTLLKPMREPCPAGEVGLLFDGDGDGFDGTNQNDELFASSDGGIEKVSVEELEMLRVNGDDDAGDFASLVFMDVDGPGEGELF